MKPWEKLAEHRVFDGWRKIKEVEYALPDGKRDMFQIKEEGDCVVALVLTRDRQVVLARQYRVGPEMVLLEMPGGGISVGEHPKDAIAREILEETGYVCGKIEHVARLFQWACSTRRLLVFVGTNAEWRQGPDGDDAEFCEAVLLSVDAFRAHLRTGQLTDVDAGYLALDHLGLL